MRIHVQLSQVGWSCQYTQTFVSLEIVWTEAFWQTHKKDKNESSMTEYWCSLYHFFLLFSVWCQGQDTAERNYLFPKNCRYWAGIQRDPPNRSNSICQASLKQQWKWNSTWYEQCFLWWVGLFSHLFSHNYLKLWHNNCRQGILYEVYCISVFNSLTEWLDFGWKYFKTCLLTTVLAESCNKLEVLWLWFIAVWKISVIRLDYISTWFYTIHMGTEYIQNQGCAYPDTISCAKEQKPGDKYLNIFCTS